MTAASARLGRRGLARLRVELSERDAAVLRQVAAHHFLTTGQVEGLCFTAHATPLAAARACRRTLARLHDHRVLMRLERRIGGVRAGSASFVWTVGPVGDRLLREARGDPRRRRWYEPSARFLDHCLAVADAHLRLRAAAARGTFELVTVELEPACWRSYFGTVGASDVLRPDLYAVTAHGKYEDCWFIEVDRGSESLPRLLAKCGQYEAYRRSGPEQQQSGTFPLVVWLLPDRKRADRLSEAIATSRLLDPALFRCLTVERFIESLAGEAG
ncbi:MAG: replication-relaxation family protein [Frankiaceae bacterium]